MNFSTNCNECCSTSLWLNDWKLEVKWRKLCNRCTQINFEMTYSLSEKLTICWIHQAHWVWGMEDWGKSQLLEMGCSYSVETPIQYQLLCVMLFSRQRLHGWGQWFHRARIPQSQGPQLTKCRWKLTELFRHPALISHNVAIQAWLPRFQIVQIIIPALELSLGGSVHNDNNHLICQIELTSYI